MVSAWLNFIVLWLSSHSPHELNPYMMTPLFKENEDLNMSYAIANDGAEIFYQVEGQGLPVIFVSGYFGVADIWNDQVSELSKNYQTVSFDRRGYGRSEKPYSPESYNIPQHVEDLKSVLDAAGIDKPAVYVTHSIGSNVVTSFTLKYPEKVAGIAYLAGNVDGPQFAEVGLIEETITRSMSKPSGAFEFFRPFNVSEKIGYEATKWPSHALIANGKAFLAHTITEQQYAQIKTPVLIVQGEKNVVSPLAFGQELHRRIDGSELKILDNVNHFPTIEAPKEVNDLIMEHLLLCYNA
ncbi:alpha/beta fold hydrolase [Escherichia coli]